MAEDLRRQGASVRELPPLNDDQAWRDAVLDAFQPSGTTRMASEPGSGVADTDCQMHGVRGLYGAGSSTLPVAGYANPTLTIVALALRLADHLVKTGRSAPISGPGGSQGVS